MQIVHHPDVTTIMTCSAGSQPEALCAVVTSHLSMCPGCMRELSLLEEIGVSLFECSVADATVAESKPPSIADGIDQIREMPPYPTKGDVPWPLIPVLGGHHLDSIEWTEIRSGISTYPIELSPDATGDLRLLRLEPGARLPEHGHLGEELTLVLRGSCSDEGGAYVVGDMADLDDETRHSVVAGDQGCILLIASEMKPPFLSQPEQVGS